MESTNLGGLGLFDDFPEAIGRATIDPHPDGGAGYRVGYLNVLILEEGLRSDLNPNVAVCVQPGGDGTKEGGDGTEEDLQSLLEDLKNSHFKPTVVRLDDVTQEGQ